MYSYLFLEVSLILLDVKLVHALGNYGETYDDEQMFKRIEDGEPKNDLETLWYVTIRTDELPVICGGSLYLKSTVITAAECVEKFIKSPENVSVLVSERKLEQIQNRELNISKIFIHEQYNDRTLEANIAIMCIKTSGVELEDSKPVNLPSSDLSLNFDFGEVVGWGRNDADYPEELKSLIYMTIPNNVCDAWYSVVYEFPSGMLNFRQACFAHCHILVCRLRTALRMSGGHFVTEIHLMTSQTSVN